MSKKIPFVANVLEPYKFAQEQLPLWKTKNVIISPENLLENLFVLSNNLADFFNIRHRDLLNRNIPKLQKEKHLSSHLKVLAHTVEVGNQAKRPMIVYALNRHQTELIIMDLSGPKARQKKFDSIKRLHSIELDVLKGDYKSAQKKAQSWDGIELLKEFGFTCSIAEKLATKKDIVSFLQVTEGTLNSFLRKYHQQIHPQKLDRETIRSIGSKATRLYAYHLEDVFKIAFWLDSPIGLGIKKKLLGDLGVDLKMPRKETEWKEILARAFKGFGFCCNHQVGRFKVDFFAAHLRIALEFDENRHKNYFPKMEKEREEYILKRYSLIRFDETTSVEDVLNAILKVTPNRPRQLIKLYEK